mmetsp:Transcript_33313/g.51667  ORF Transcript_33313/g.51667 Transcript_33313/m.51667 type:complete len:368 (-) Transcript_33313:29-1132(-)
MRVGLVALAVALLAFSAAEEFEDFKACYTPPAGDIDCIELSPRPDVYLQDENLADSWDWRNHEGRDLTTAVMNQHIPHYCGACWAFGPLAALSDRIKIARKAAWPEIQLAPQVLLNCGAAKGYEVGCSGGYAHATYDYAHKYGVTDATCQSYRARELSCDPENICKNCAHDLKCFAVHQPAKYHVKEFGQVRGERNMMAEIQERGPIACGISVNKALLNYKGGIFHDHTGSMQIKHVVSLVGWGGVGSSKYWIARNSWGSYWGENGYFRIARGINNMNLESDCYWATPEFDQERLSRGMAEDSETDADLVMKSDPSIPTDAEVDHDTAEPEEFDDDLDMQELSVPDVSDNGLDFSDDLSFEDDNSDF